MAILDEPPKQGTRRSTLERIRVLLGKLSPTELRVAEQILQEPGQAVALSIGEFAAFCSVSQPTISRLCRKLGFSGYAALRIGIANELAATHSSPEQASHRGEQGFAAQVAAFEALTEMHQAGYAIRTAHHVEIWPVLDLAHTGARLADRLTEIAVPALCAPLLVNWAQRARRFPPKTLVIILSHTEVDALIGGAFKAAQASGAQILYCSTQSAGAIASQANWLVPLPLTTPSELAELALIEALIHTTTAVFNLVLPEGPSSPWISWPFVRKVFLPNGDGDPIPALLLTHEDPPQPHPVVLSFGSFQLCKEDGLPGTHENYIWRCLTSAQLNAGYHVLIVDARAHGERKRPWEQTVELLRQSFQGHGDDDLAAAISDAPALIDGLLALGVTTDPPQIAAVGTSWGTQQVMRVCAGDPRINCVVCVLPFIHMFHSAYFEDLETTPRMVKNEPGPWLAQALVPRPLLFLIAGDDELDNPEQIQPFIDTLRQTYTEANVTDHFVATVIPGLTHIYHQEQIDASLAWLRRHFS